MSVTTTRIAHRRRDPQREAESALEGAIAPGLPLMADRHPVRSAIENMGEIYRLTPGEIRILHAVMEVGGIRDIALALAVSPATVKTHLHRIFQKTGTTGQVDLIRLVARAASSET